MTRRSTKAPLGEGGAFCIRDRGWNPLLQRGGDAAQIESGGVRGAGYFATVDGEGGGVWEGGDEVSC